ncbi:hydrolase, NUDIX family domain protein [Burkholderia pseudomallei TSV28]|nr:hydrolase, NUDIX family domain protein [Burkholderia pseudomallei TSV28]
MRRAPLPAYRSLSAMPFACRFRLPLLTPGPLPLAPSPFYSLPFTFTLRPRPVSRFQPSAGSPPFGQRRAPARARRPGATTARAGHDAHRPSAFGALTNPCKTCPLRMPRDHACKHGGICHAMQPNRACPQSIVPSTDTRRPPGATIACPTRSRPCTSMHT